MPIITWRDTLAALEIEQCGAGRYTAPNIAMPYPRIFGGQLLAQTLLVAEAGAPGKQVKSMHVAFPREGDPLRAVEYRVAVHQDGRTFALQSILAVQGERVVMSASISLHVPEAGAEHQSVGFEAPPPEAARPVDLRMIPWETRAVDGVDLADRSIGPPVYQLWMRAAECPARPGFHSALLVHATDLGLIGTSLRALPDLGEADSPDRIHTAVTTHTLWFHRAVALDDWVLLDQHSPIVSGARGFATGRAYTRDGSLCVSYAQESLIRPVA